MHALDVCVYVMQGVLCYVPQKHVFGSHGCFAYIDEQMHESKCPGKGLVALPRMVMDNDGQVARTGAWSARKLYVTKALSLSLTTHK